MATRPVLATIPCRQPQHTNPWRGPLIFGRGAPLRHRCSRGASTGTPDCASRTSPRIGPFGHSVPTIETGFPIAPPLQAGAGRKKCPPGYNRCGRFSCTIRTGVIPSYFSKSEPVARETIRSLRSRSPSRHADGPSFGAGMPVFSFAVWRCVSEADEAIICSGRLFEMGDRKRVVAFSFFEPPHPMVSVTGRSVSDGIRSTWATASSTWARASSSTACGPS